MERVKWGRRMTEEIIELIKEQNEKLTELNTNVQTLADMLGHLNSTHRQYAEDTYLRNRGDL